MDKIASFTVNHLDLIPGVYVSRKDYVGKEVLTTFDLRMTAPNREPVMNTAELHPIEHLAATYLRNNDEWKEKVIYFGPMGCRTGCYLILAGDYESKDVVGLVRDTFAFIADYEGEIPGAAAKDCGNYLECAGIGLYLTNIFGTIAIAAAWTDLGRNYEIHRKLFSFCWKWSMLCFVLPIILIPLSGFLRIQTFDIHIIQQIVFAFTTVCFIIWAIGIMQIPFLIYAKIVNQISKQKNHQVRHF